MHLLLIVIVSGVIFYTKMAPKRAAFTGLLTGLTLALQAGSAFDSVILVLISVVCAYMTAMIAK